MAGLDALTDPRAVRRQLGYVAQEVAIDKILTGRELLQLQGDLYHLPQLRDQRMAELIERLAMEPWVDRRCGTYSGGMRRRLDLPRQVCCTDPAFLCWMNRPSALISRAGRHLGSPASARQSGHQCAAQQPLPRGGRGPG